jgi:uncharacterized protein (TIGR00251 family)
MNRDWCCAVEGCIRLAVQIMPNAKKSEVLGLFDDVLKIRLQAQPIDGKANDALIRYLAKLLDVPKSAVFLTHGHTSRRKIIEVCASRLTVDVVRKLLLPPMSG